MHESYPPSAPLIIDQVNAYIAQVPLEKSLEFSFGSRHEKVIGLIEIKTKQGLIGYGEANWGGSLRGGQQFLTLVSERVRPSLLGKDAFQTTPIWSSMSELNQDANRVSALGAVDMALYDLKGKLLGRPVCELLGGAMRTSIPMYASGLMIRSLAELESEAAELLAQGFSGFKMRVGRDIQADPERVRRVRAIIGYDKKLMVDANGHLNRREALNLGRQLLEFQLEHFEEPLPKWDIEGHIWLAQQLPMPLAAGECTQLQNMKELLTHRAAQVLLPDVTITGFTETEKILTLAQAFNTDIILHNFEAGIGLAGTLHVAAAHPELKQLQELDTTPNPLRSDLTFPALKPQNGKLPVPMGPGLGVELNWDLLNHYLVAKA